MEHNTVPNHKGWPVLNNIVPFLLDLLYYPQTLQKVYGDVFRMPLSLFKPIFIFSPSGIQHVLEKNHSNYIKGSSYDALKLALGEGLLTGEGPSWKTSRKFIQPYSYDDVITRFITVIEKHSEDMVKEWGTQTGPFSINRPMKELTLAIATECFFGVHMKDISFDIPKTVDKLNHIIAEEMRFPRNQIPYAVPTYNHVVSRKLMKQINQEIEKLSKDMDADQYNLLALLLSNPSFSKQQIRDEIITFLTAGYETTANTLMYILALLANHPDIQDEIRKELKEQPFSPNDYKKWKSIYPLLHASIQEALRLYPPAWMISRKALNDDVIDNFLIPKGSEILLDLYLIHRHPDYWKNPETFDPARFLSPPKEKFSFLPFGGGPRVCIGQHFAMLEIMTALYHILTTFRLHPINCTIIPTPQVTLTPKHDLTIQCIPL